MVKKQFYGSPQITKCETCRTDVRYIKLYEDSKEKNILVDAQAELRYTLQICKDDVYYKPVYFFKPHNCSGDKT